MIAAMPKILVIEDNPEVQEVLRTVLVLKEFEVVEASTGLQALQLGKNVSPDLIILDIMLPDLDGFELCKKLREIPETNPVPILMLTALTDVLNRVKGLDAGADDYLTKPFDTLELIARVKALLRRKGNVSVESRKALKVKDFEIDPSAYILSVSGNQIPDLTPREFDILYLLIKNSPNPISRENIFQVIWGKSEKHYTRVIDIHIAKIRKKLGSQASRIKTIPAKGYAFLSR